MSASNNGVVRIARKGLKKFAFGEEGQPGSEPFEVDVVVAFQAWMNIDDGFREEEQPGGRRAIPDEKMHEYHATAVQFVRQLATDPKKPGAGMPDITTAEALDFLARLREAYDDMAYFFRPKSREERGSPGTSEAESSSTSPKTELRFSTEGG
jgi:hypothetical protein